MYISVIPQIESPQLEPDVSQKETKRKRVETENHKSKRKKPNEYSESSKKINGKPKELDKRNNSTEIKLDSSRGLYFKTSRKKQTALRTTCKVEREKVEDSDILIIDDDKESVSEISSVPGKLDFLSLVLEFFFLTSHFPFLFIYACCNIQVIYMYKIRNGNLTN